MHLCFIEQKELMHRKAESHRECMAELEFQYRQSSSRASTLSQHILLLPTCANYECIASQIWVQPSLPAYDPGTSHPWQAQFTLDIGGTLEDERPLFPGSDVCASSCSQDTQLECRTPVRITSGEFQQTPFFLSSHLPSQGWGQQYLPSAYVCIPLSFVGA